MSLKTQNWPGSNKDILYFFKLKTKNANHRYPLKSEADV